MININYNLKRHIELLKQKPLFRENRKEALELKKYGAIVGQHINWEDRFEIAPVMQNF